MFIEILKTFIESRVEFKILHYLYPLVIARSPANACPLPRADVLPAFTQASQSDGGSDVLLVLVLANISYLYREGMNDILF